MWQLQRPDALRARWAGRLSSGVYSFSQLLLSPSFLCPSPASVSAVSSTSSPCWYKLLLYISNILHLEWAIYRPRTTGWGGGIEAQMGGLLTKGSLSKLLNPCLSGPPATPLLNPETLLRHTLNIQEMSPLRPLNTLERSLGLDIFY